MDNTTRIKRRHSPDGWLQTRHGAPWRSMIVAAVVAATACNESAPSVTGPETPAQKAYSFASVTGTDQSAAAGEPLPVPITVQVKDEAGKPASNLLVEFAIASGGGSVSSGSVLTDADGRASATWTLGWAVGKQSLWIHHGSSPSASAFVNADAAVNPRSDVLVVRGAESPSVTVLISGADQTPDGRRLTLPDSIVYLPQYDPFNTAAPVWLMALSRGLAPAVTSPQWTAGPDTITLAFVQPFKISLTVWVFENFQQNSAIARRDVNNTVAFWRSHLWGLELGELKILDATLYAGSRISCTNQFVTPDPAAITIYYSISADIGANAGFACSPRVVIMTPLPGTGLPFLLAHELGHAFGLAHVPDRLNFMHGTASNAGATTGQISRAHLSPSSAINSVYRFRPASDLAACCISDRFDF
jgi:hypothetical protein